MGRGHPDSYSAGGYGKGWEMKRNKPNKQWSRIFDQSEPCEITEQHQALFDKWAAQQIARDRRTARRIEAAIDLQGIRYNP